MRCYHSQRVVATGGNEEILTEVAHECCVSVPGGRVDDGGSYTARVSFEIPKEAPPSSHHNMYPRWVWFISASVRGGLLDETAKNLPPLWGTPPLRPSILPLIDLTWPGNDPTLSLM